MGKDSEEVRHDSGNVVGSLGSARGKCHVDHCHKTGKIRGLLNGSTNRALGFFREDPEAFRRAIEYLAGASVLTSSTQADAGESSVSPQSP